MTASPQHVDLVVVGNGAVGTAIAFRFKRAHPDARVAVVGPARRPGAASCAAGLMLNVYGELDADALACAAGRARHAWARAARALWPAWLEELATVAGTDPPIVNRGTVVIANSRATPLDEANYDAVLAAARADGEPHAEIDPRSLRGYHPADHRRALRVVHLPNEGSVDSRRVLAVVDAALDGVGVTRVDTTAVAVAPGPHGPVVTLECGGAIRAADVVLAAGSYTQELIATIPELVPRIPRLFFGTGNGVRLSIERRFHPDLEFPDTVIRTTNRGNACGVHVVPLGPDRCYVGATNHVSTIAETAPRISALHFLLQSCMDEVNTGFHATNADPVLGHRPTSADTYPLIGPTSVDGLWLATGTKRDGFHGSPHIADALVRALDGDPSGLEPCFRPERAPIVTMTRAQGIDRAVEHRLSGAMQHDLAYPRCGWEGVIRDSVRSQVETLYDRAGLTVGVPPEMLNMYAHGHLRADVLSRPAVAAPSIEPAGLEVSAP